MKTKLMMAGVCALTLTANAQLFTSGNGLNNTSPSNVELGGSLGHNTDIRQRGYNMAFSGGGRFGIGYNSGSFPLSTAYSHPATSNKINLYVDEDQTGIYLEHDFNSSLSYNGGFISLFVKNITNASSGQFNTGLYSEVDNSVQNVGVASNVGLAGIGTYNFGTQIVAFNGSLGCGGIFAASYSARKIGVFATVTNGVNSPPILSADYAGIFDGDTYTYGTVYASNPLFNGSDRRFKKDITKLESVREKIMKLNGYTYSFKTDEFKNKNFSKDQQIGLIAQEVQDVFPQLVKEQEGYLAVNYQGMVPVLLEAIKDLQKQVDDQKQLITELSQKASGATGINSLGSVETGFQMSQNEPNPFTHETVVKYTLPQTTSNAFMAVYDLTGKQISTFPIVEKGTSSITITSEKLAAGIYIYSIVADGKVMDSKRMIVSEK